MSFGYGKSYGYSYGLADPVSLLLPLEDMLYYDGSGPHPVNLPVGDVGLLDSDAAISGSNLASLPIVGVSIAHTGERAFSFYDDFFERFYIKTEAIDFGVAAKTTLVPFKVWNARLDTGILNLITPLNLENDGVDLQGATVPSVFTPLREITHTGRALAAGDTQILGSYLYQFTPEQTLEIPVKGLRGKLWPLPINWASGFHQTLEFKTEILTSRAGKEQRIAIRTTPRRSFEFDSVADGAARRELNLALDTAHFVDFIIPDAPRYALTVSDATAGATVLSFAELPVWAATGVIVTLSHGRRVGLARIQTTDSDTDTVELSEGLTGDWPTGTRVCPGIVGALDDEVSTRRLTDDVVDVGLQLAERPGYQDYIAPAAAPVTHNNREILLAKPNWASTPSVSHSWVSEWVDYGKGVIARFVPTDFGGRLIRWTYSRASYAEVMAVQDTFMRARGRRGEFYVPSWESDFTPKADLTAATKTMRVAGVEAAEVYAGSTVYGRLLIQLADGTRFYRKIVSASTVVDGYGQDSLLTFDTEWPSNIPVGDIALVCFLLCARFASDSLTIEWLTDDKANVQFNLQTLEDLSPET